MSAKRTKRKPSAKQTVERQIREEQSRREWCIEQASLACPESGERVVAMAEKIYNWVYGAKQECPQTVPEWMK